MPTVPDWRPEPGKHAIVLLSSKIPGPADMVASTPSATEDRVASALDLNSGFHHWARPFSASFFARKAERIAAARYRLSWVYAGPFKASNTSADERRFATALIYGRSSRARLNRHSPKCLFPVRRFRRSARCVVARPQSFATCRPLPHIFGGPT